MNKLILILCIFFISCSPLQYPIVTKYKETNVKIKYERVKTTRPYKKIYINNTKRDFIIWLTLSSIIGTLTLK